MRPAAAASQYGKLESSTGGGRLSDPAHVRALHSNQLDVLDDDRRKCDGDDVQHDRIPVARTSGSAGFQDWPEGIAKLTTGRTTTSFVPLTSAYSGRSRSHAVMGTRRQTMRRRMWRPPPRIQGTIIFCIWFLRTFRLRS
jgi:hypothetical protein